MNRSFTYALAAVPLFTLACARAVPPRTSLAVVVPLDVQRGAMSAGALGCSISGAGPTVFAWAEIQYAEAVRGAMVAAFAEHGLQSDYWISGMENYGARVVKA